MVDDCLKTPHRLIGMIQPTGDDGRLHSIGCAGKLTQFSETEDGRYMITLTGISRYRLDSEIEGFAPYRHFNVQWVGFEKDREIPEKDSPSLSDSNNESVIYRVPVPEALSAESDASSCDGVTR